MNTVRLERKILPLKHNIEHGITGTLTKDKLNKYLPGAALLYLKYD
jgi:hypothetical protein